MSKLLDDKIKVSYYFIYNIHYFYHSLSLILIVQFITHSWQFLIISLIIPSITLFFTLTHNSDLTHPQYCITQMGSIVYTSLHLPHSHSHYYHYYYCYYLCCCYYYWTVHEVTKIVEHAHQYYYNSNLNIINLPNLPTYHEFLQQWTLHFSNMLHTLIPNSTPTHMQIPYHPQP